MLGLFLHDGKVMIKRLAELCGMNKPEYSSEGDLMHMMTFGDVERSAMPSLKIELRDFLFKLGFD
jgi:hypothetical protein